VTVSLLKSYTLVAILLVKERQQLEVKWRKSTKYLFRNKSCVCVLHSRRGDLYQSFSIIFCIFMDLFIL
jgi:hypothetical protein